MPFSLRLGDATRARLRAAAAKLVSAQTPAATHLPFFSYLPPSLPSHSFPLSLSPSPLASSLVPPPYPYSPSFRSSLPPSLTHSLLPSFPSSVLLSLPLSSSFPPRSLLSSRPPPSALFLFCLRPSPLRVPARSFRPALRAFLSSSLRSSFGVGARLFDHERRRLR